MRGRNIHSISPCNPLQTGDERYPSKDHAISPHSVTDIPNRILPHLDDAQPLLCVCCLIGTIALGYERAWQYDMLIIRSFLIKGLEEQAMRTHIYITTLHTTPALAIPYQYIL